MANLVVSRIDRGSEGGVRPVRVSRKKRSRIVTRVHRTGKPELVQIMRDLNPGLTRREAERDYDRVTAAINGWLRAFTRDFPKGIHAKLLLANCFSVNICWIDGRHRGAFDAPALWVQTSGKVRSNLRRLRLRSFSEWKARRQGGTNLTP